MERKYTEEEAIQTVIQTWLNATEAGDTEKVLGLMTDDVVFMVPGQEPFGKEVFRALAEQQKDMHLRAKSEIKEIQLLGEYAVVRTYLEITITTKPNTTPIKRSGYSMSILRKEQDGQWRIARDANLLTPQKI